MAVIQPVAFEGIPDSWILTAMTQKVVYKPVSIKMVRYIDDSDATTVSVTACLRADCGLRKALLTIGRLVCPLFLSALGTNKIACYPNRMCSVQEHVPLVFP
jgi:hypothetical protein